MPRKVRTRKYGKRKHRRSLKRKSKKTRHFRKRHMHKSKKRRQKRGAGPGEFVLNPDEMGAKEEDICNTTRNALKIGEHRQAPSIWDVRFINNETFIKYLKDINLVEERDYTPEQIAYIRDAAYDAYNDPNKSYIQMYACAGGASVSWGLKWINKDKTSKDYFKDVVENAGFLTKDEAKYEVQKWGKWNEDKWNELKKDDKDRIKVEDIKSFSETLTEFIAATPIVVVDGVPDFSKMDLKRFNMYLFLNNFLKQVGYPETSMMAVRETVTDLINKEVMEFNDESGELIWDHPSVNLHDVAMAAAKGPGRSGTTQGLYGRMFKNRYNDHCYSTWDNCNSHADSYQFHIKSDPRRIMLFNQCNLDYDLCKEIRKDPNRRKEWDDYKKDVDVSSSPRDLNTVLDNQ